VRAKRDDIHAQDRFLASEKDDRPNRDGRQSLLGALELACWAVRPIGGIAYVADELGSELTRAPSRAGHDRVAVASRAGDRADPRIAQRCSMRWLLCTAVPLCSLIIAPCLASGASNAALDEAAAVVKRRRLLDAAELSCSTFVHEGVEKGVHAVAVREKHDRRCGGDPDVAPIRFHMQIDRRRKRVLWDNNPDVEMRPLP
jgi:hypothetical protein